MMHLPGHARYRHFLILFLVIMAIGLTLVTIGMTGLYHASNVCGFGHAHCPSTDSKTHIVVTGGYVFVAGFYGLLLLAIVYAINHARHHKHHDHK